METAVVTIPVNKITDWPSFHEVFQRTLGSRIFTAAT